MLTAQLKRMVPCYYGDFYPLTQYSRDPHDWIAWQFHLPERNEGMVQSFRRSECESSTLTVRLHGLDPAATYSVHDLDKEDPVTLSGKKLIEEGFVISTVNRPGAVVVHYSAQ